jgi:hypothetical protein
MAVMSMETAETAMEIDGDGSGGTSLSQQGAGTETSCNDPEKKPFIRIACYFLFRVIVT